MTRDMTRLVEQIVFLEAVDGRHVGMNAGKYLAAARAAREIVERELGRLSMRDFVTQDLPALQTTAENIYFEGHHHFADLDGSGDAALARTLAVSVLKRVGFEKLA